MVLKELSPQTQPATYNYGTSYYPGTSSDVGDESSLSRRGRARRRGVFGGALCTLITSLDTCNQVARIIALTAMSMDRYLALVHPFRLMGLRTHSKTIWINPLIWAASLTLALPTWVHFKVIRFQYGLESCPFDLVSPHEVLYYGPDL